MKNKFVIPELQEKKKRLDNMRSFYRPLNREELDMHARNYEEILRAKIEEKRMLRKAKLSEFGGSVNTSKLKTKYNHEVVKSERQKKMEKELIRNETKQKRAKIQQYAKIVKEMHWPEVSPKKQREMKMLKKSVDEKSKSPEVTYGQAASSRDNKKNSYLSTRQSHRRSMNDSNYSNSETTTLKEKPYSTKRTKVNWKKFINPMVPKPKLKRKGHIDDYLLKKRIERQEKENDTFEGEPRKYQLSMNWQKVNPQDITDPDQIELIREKTRALEKEAQMYEEKIRVGGDLKNPTEANDLLINAIEAKLSILQNI